MPVDPVLGLTRAEARRLRSHPRIQPAPSVHRTERRPLGMAPLPFLGGLAVTALLLAVVLWATVSWIPGIALLTVTATLLGLFWAGVRRQPESPTSRTLAGLNARARDLVAYLGSGGRTWTRTGARVVSLRWRRLQLQRELRHRLRPLGDAVHRGDATRAAALKKETAELQQRLDELCEREETVVWAARSEIERERSPVQPTATFTPVEPTGESTADGDRRVSA